MRLGTFLASAGVLFALGVVGFRIIDLEQRLAVLAAHDDRREADAARPEQPTAAGSPTSSTRDYEARFRALEQRVANLENRGQNWPMPSGVGEDRMKQEQAILSVVERENSRIREVQLEWHKARWLETRKQQLAAFAYSQQLQPAQTTHIYEALERELDGLAEVMKRPTFAEDPDQVASDWLKVLGQTDQQAQDVLSPTQYQTWVQGRLFERKVLWPWLPDSAPQSAQN
jgi:hypothetical protein